VNNKERKIPFLRDVMMMMMMKRSEEKRKEGTRTKPKEGKSGGVVRHRRKRPNNNNNKEKQNNREHPQHSTQQTMLSLSRTWHPKISFFNHTGQRLYCTLSVCRTGRPLKPSLSRSLAPAYEPVRTAL
jgi:hypothetical protein